MNPIEIINPNSDNLVNYSIASTSIPDVAFVSDVVKPDSISNLIKNNVFIVYSIENNSNPIK